LLPEIAGVVKRSGIVKITRRNDRAIKADAIAVMQSRHGCHRSGVVLSIVCTSRLGRFRVDAEPQGKAGIAAVGQRLDPLRLNIHLLAHRAWTVCFRFALIDDVSGDEQVVAIVDPRRQGKGCGGIVGLQGQRSGKHECSRSQQRSKPRPSSQEEERGRGERQRGDQPPTQWPPRMFPKPQPAAVSEHRPEYRLSGPNFFCCDKKMRPGAESARRDGSLRQKRWGSSCQTVLADGASTGQVKNAFDVECLREQVEQMRPFDPVSGTH
jgi:hypothetical protein